MKIVYIHGANATATSFNYIREHINESGTPLSYSSSNGFANNLTEMSVAIQRLRGPVFFVAHSLGGVYALHLAQQISDQVAGAVTLSTPYGGSREADMVRMFLPNSQLMRDIAPGSEPMSAMANMTVPANWTNVVTTQGSNPFIAAANDGVVTVDSMKAMGNRMRLVDLDLNHYEVVLSPRVIKIIRDRIERS
jgi:pimeloyl-ACP methyl ester carboxylesterase